MTNERLLRLIAGLLIVSSLGDVVEHTEPFEKLEKYTANLIDEFLIKEVGLEENKHDS